MDDKTPLRLERHTSPLKHAIDHAGRLAAVLAKLEDAIVRETAESKDDPKARPSSPAIWIMGREGEVEAFALDVTREWRERRVDEARAAGTLERYLADLHAALRDVLGIERPACCIAPRMPPPDLWEQRAAFSSAPLSEATDPVRSTKEAITRDAITLTPPIASAILSSEP